MAAGLVLAAAGLACAVLLPGLAGLLPAALLAGAGIGAVTPLGFAALLSLVTGAPDGPERNGARRRSVHPTVQGWPGPSATGKIPADVQTASH